MSSEYPRRGRNWFTAMGLLFIIMAVIVLVQNMIIWSPEFVYDFLVGPDITNEKISLAMICLLYTSPSPRDRTRSRMPSSA